jgi:hypothetical protein
MIAGVTRRSDPDVNGRETAAMLAPALQGPVYERGWKW